VIDLAPGIERAVRAQLAREARRRAMNLLELRAGDHYPEVDRAVSEYGADALGAVGGDAAQCKAAVVASGRELPYACIPTGRDNLFARDLGVNPGDAIAALCAFARGCERFVDLGEVNGITFVNYAALGLDCTPAGASGPSGVRSGRSVAAYVVRRRHPPLHLRWFAAGGRESATAVFVSNNRCRFESHAIGGRSRLDGGVLGVGVLELRATAAPSPNPAWRELVAPVFELDADTPVAADIDGQAASLEPPVRFRILPRALRARIASVS
jgi:diacylglycerol kinase family enzyme